ncbi:MAG: hypothetical protein IJD59_03655 [Clostridia bacterium]|nr:hypothetical protein [Clostridia bacterium]
MKKRILKIAAFILAVALIYGVACFANSLVGNPISKMMARRTAQKHLEAQYADTDYVIDSVSYSFKVGGYFVHIVSPSSMDGNFTLWVSMLGKLTNDDYASRVEGHRNVASRLFFEYRDMVDGVLNSYAYPYTVDMGFGDLEFQRELGEEPIEGALELSDLVNDQFYNVGELGAKNGKLVLYIDSDTVTYEKAAEILLKTKEMMDGAGISFYSVHLVLRYPPYDAQESYKRPEGEINLKDFLYTDIEEDGLIERIVKCAEETQADYNRQDNEK